MIDTDTLLAAIESTAWHLRQRDHDVDEDVIAQYLDWRDQPPFDSDWTAADALVQARKRGLSAQRIEAIDAESKQVRQVAFARALRVSDHDELAAYLSDDAGLIVEAERLGIDSAWIAALLRRNARPAAPFGPLL
ncbi:MAG: hypothetical protein JF591_16775 [Lysobacter sp.]|nr:hypothetical protein [Lysobacter sp.]